MFKKNFVLHILLICIFHVNFLLAHPQTQMKHDFSVHNNENDFIGCLERSLPVLSNDKNLLTENLNNLIKDINNNPNMALAFNILLKSDTLTAQEKTNWIKKNLSKLPTPFLMLMSIFEDNLEIAKHIHVLSNAYLLIDLDRCTDKSVEEGIFLFREMLLPKIFERFGIDINNSDVQKAQQVMLEMEKIFFEKGGFEKFDQEYSISYLPPYWLAYHGMKPMIDGNQLDNNSLFKPADQYNQIKQKVFKELQGYASQRGNAKTPAR